MRPEGASNEKNRGMWETKNLRSWEHTLQKIIDVYFFIFINFKSPAYEIIIHVVQSHVEITEKHSNKHNLFSKNTSFFTYIFQTL